MFDVSCDTILPVEYVEIQSISVRGELGPLTVWQTPNTFQGKHEEMEEWTKVYDATHPPSREMTELVLDPPLRLRPGESLGLYVHSALPGDEAIVYDNQRNHTTYRDRVFKVLPGLAHLSNRPFGKRGFWGRPWRCNREFVGRMEYGVRWKMWTPTSFNPATKADPRAGCPPLQPARHAAGEEEHNERAAQQPSAVEGSGAFARAALEPTRVQVGAGADAHGAVGAGEALLARAGLAERGRVGRGGGGAAELRGLSLIHI